MLEEAIRDGLTIRLDSLNDTDGQTLTAQGHTDCPGRTVALTINYAGEARETQYCHNPTDYGHTVPAYLLNSSAARPSGPMSEAEKAARAELIRRGKEMLAATDVRQAFIRNIAGSKTHAKEMSAWAMARIVRRDRTFGRFADKWNVDLVPWCLNVREM